MGERARQWMAKYFLLLVCLTVIVNGRNWTEFVWTMTTERVILTAHCLSSEKKIRKDLFIYYLLVLRNTLSFVGRLSTLCLALHSSDIIMAINLSERGHRVHTARSTSYVRAIHYSEHRVRQETSNRFPSRSMFVHIFFSSNIHALLQLLMQLPSLVAYVSRIWMRSLEFACKKRHRFFSPVFHLVLWVANYSASASQHRLRFLFVFSHDGWAMNREHTHALVSFLNIVCWRTWLERAHCTIRFLR